MVLLPVSQQIRSDVVKKYHSGYKGKFGTHQPRFKADKEEYPGPGEYVIKESDAENDTAAKTKQKQPPGGFNYDQNCVFKSQTQREPYGKIESKQKQLFSYQKCIYKLFF